ncbi:MAG TPA: hypothetical protein EYN59_04185 [Candidatus Marinimicrobia bacterium]|nr:hypothetical protein [Candidatus Neomarinimicrobiota bacterium]
MKKPIIITVFFILTFQPVFGNEKYFSQVQKTAKAYRVETSGDKMKIVPDEKGKDSFYITLASNRNNFEMVMLVGYIAAGQAMKTGYEPETFFVSVDVPLGEGFRLVTTATKKRAEARFSLEIGITGNKSLA